MRVPDPLDVAAEYVVAAVVSGFWTGRCLALLAAWGAMLARSRLTLLRIDVLKALGRRDAARRVCVAALRRCERRMTRLTSDEKGTGCAP